MTQTNEYFGRKFCVFILTHGRPDNLPTLKWLNTTHYTGDIKLIVDDQDSRKQEYIDKYGDMVYVFNKQESAKKTDLGDNFLKLNTVLIARNESWDIARELGYTHFCEMDDDYSQVRVRAVKDQTLKAYKCTDLDRLFSKMLDFLDDNDKMHCVAMMQAGDYIGGMGNKYFNPKPGILAPRKVMQTFFCRIDRPFKFVGRMNDDVNTYVTLGNRGVLFMSLHVLCLLQGITQANAGGLTDMYKEMGTYVKSFYTVMMCPSAVVVKPMGPVHKRFHHQINWNLCVPKIISGRYKKQ